eukprot:336150-Amphidinium_carterae.1
MQVHKPRQEFDLQAGILFRTSPDKDDMKSIDAFGWMEETLYLLQITSAQQHAHAAENHITEIFGRRLPKEVKNIKLWYVTPCSHSRLNLIQRESADKTKVPKIKKKLLNKTCATNTVHVESECSKWAPYLQKCLCHQAAEHHGNDERPVKWRRLTKSQGAEQTYSSRFKHVFRHVFEHCSSGLDVNIL